MILITTADFRTSGTTPALGPGLAHKVLAYLGVPAAPPTLAALAALVTAYTTRVPWESASRIVKRARTGQQIDCPRWPAEFWGDAMRLGTGGTCFESNYAFFSLLRFLGYEGCLTINNMHEAIGCHTALVIHLDGQRYLVDVGLPIYAPLPLPTSNVPVLHQTALHTYSVTASAVPNLLVITRDRHPRPDCFTLVDLPVDDAAYRRATVNDYGSEGLFLDRVILSRVIDGAIWRFYGEEPPYQLERFRDGDKTFYYLGEDRAAAAEQVAAHFGFDWQTLHQALEAVAVVPS